MVSIQEQFIIKSGLWWRMYGTFFKAPEMAARHVGKIIDFLDDKFDEKNEHMIDDKHKKLQTVHNWIGNKNKASTKTLQALDELFRKRK